jgi:hypothetical protein
VVGGLPFWPLELGPLIFDSCPPRTSRFNLGNLQENTKNYEDQLRHVVFYMETVTK